MKHGFRGSAVLGAIALVLLGIRCGGDDEGAARGGATGGSRGGVGGAAGEASGGSADAGAGGDAGVEAGRGGSGGSAGSAASTGGTGGEIGTDGTSGTGGAGGIGGSDSGATLCQEICVNAWCGVPFSDPCPLNDAACVSACLQDCGPATAPCTETELNTLRACAGRCDSLWPCIADVACIEGR
jgi:hypothetical protein